MNRLGLALVLVVVAHGSARADDRSEAESLFLQGKKLMASKRFADACASFEESYKLDPGIGAQLNIARCYEEWGRIGTAYNAYVKALEQARAASDPRASKIAELVEGLDTQVPRLTIRAPRNAPATFKVTIDRTPIARLGEPLVLDPGPKTVEWSVGRGPRKQKLLMLERGAESEVTLDLPGDAGGEAGGSEDGSAASRPGRGQRIGGIALAGAGALAIGVSSVMALSARGSYNDALDAYCGGKKNACDPTGLERTRDARSTANVATVIFLAGTAAIGGGVALYLLAPAGARPAPGSERQASRYVVPSIAPGAAGLVFGGTY